MAKKKSRVAQNMAQRKVIADSRRIYKSVRKSERTTKKK